MCVYLHCEILFANLRTSVATGWVPGRYISTLIQYREKGCARAPWLYHVIEHMVSLFFASPELLVSR